jgi:hypothetical protein
VPYFHPLKSFVTEIDEFFEENFETTIRWYDSI